MPLGTNRGAKGFIYGVTRRGGFKVSTLLRFWIGESSRMSRTENKRHWLSLPPVAK